MSRQLTFGSAGVIVVTLVAGLTGCGLRDGAAEAPATTSGSQPDTSDIAEDMEAEPTEPTESPAADQADTAELEQLLDEAEGIMTGVEQEMADDATS